MLCYSNAEIFPARPASAYDQNLTRMSLLWLVLCLCGLACSNHFSPSISFPPILKAVTQILPLPGSLPSLPPSVRVIFFPILIALWNKPWAGCWSHPLTHSCVSSAMCLHSSSVAQSCQTLCSPMDYSLPGSSVHGIFQARTLEWVAISPPGALPNPGTKPSYPALADKFFTTEPPGMPYLSFLSLTLPNQLDCQFLEYHVLLHVSHFVSLPVSKSSVKTEERTYKVE